MLRRFGATIAPDCTIRPTVHIEVPWLLEMDSGATLGDHAIVYAGNGIVAGSDPEEELIETRLKLRPMLDLLTGS